MSESTLFITLGILFFFLILLLLSYKLFPENRTKQSKSNQNTKSIRTIDKTQPFSFDDISYIFGNNNSTKENFIEAIEQLIRHHGKIHAKMGDLPHPDFKRYEMLIITLCKNSNVDKDAIFMLEKKLQALNVRYSHLIDEAVRKGLAARY